MADPSLTTYAPSLLPPTDKPFCSPSPCTTPPSTDLVQACSTLLQLLRQPEMTQARSSDLPSLSRAFLTYLISSNLADAPSLSCSLRFTSTVPTSPSQFQPDRPRLFISARSRPHDESCLAMPIPLFRPTFTSHLSLCRVTGLHDSHRPLRLGTTFLRL